MRLIKPQGSWFYKPIRNILEYNSIANIYTLVFTQTKQRINKKK
jgi:hypothetical protein